MYSRKLLAGRLIASLVAQASMSEKTVPRSLPMTARGHQE